jgi:hypothetical protein
MMRKTLIIVTGSIWVLTVFADPPSKTEAGASASNSTSASVSQSGAQASHDSAAQVTGPGVSGAAAGSASGSARTPSATKAPATAGSKPKSSSAPSSGAASGELASGTAVNAVLSRPVDAKKNKAGDPVTATASQDVKSNGKVVIRKGSKLLGHVTEAKAAGKGESQSALGIVFDKAVLKNGQEVPLNVAVQAIAAAESASSLGGHDATSDFGGAAGAAGGGAASRGLMGGVGGAGSVAGGVTGGVMRGPTGAAGGIGSTVGSTIGATGAASHGAAGNLNAVGALTSESKGVMGLKGLDLASSAAGSAQGSLITSAGKNVHLDSGTQLLLMATGAAHADSGHEKETKPAK